VNPVKWQYRGNRFFNLARREQIILNLSYIFVIWLRCAPDYKQLLVGGENHSSMQNRIGPPKPGHAGSTPAPPASN